MGDNVRAFLTGVAIAGMSTVMFEANKFVLKSLWGVNCIAAKMAGGMIKELIIPKLADDEGGLKVVVEVQRESETES